MNDDFYEALMFQRLINWIFEPEGTPQTEQRAQEITRQVARQKQRASAQKEVQKNRVENG